MDKLEVLKGYFGYESFRDGQDELISAILENRDILGIMPTGAGKSICFQVPAIMKEGVTVVISPLISLMQDQVSALKQAKIPAAYINSSLNQNQINLVIENAKIGKYKLIYIAPERLLSESFLILAKYIKIAMVVIDEAHCISSWGQDFRPSYTDIPKFINGLKEKPVVAALTATATERVQEDIIKLIRLNNPKILVTGFNRKNLYFEVDKPKNKMQSLLSFVKDNVEKSGIVYCNTRKIVEEVTEALNNAGYKATRYHAGLDENERKTNQENFVYDKISIMVATNAFGMGIDKSNVSYVIHYNMPRDVESYYQEAGRAGRDGQNARCILYYSGQDVITAKWLIENSKDRTYEDEATEKMLKAREYARLKSMIFYSTTNDCLREYILRYFGEKPENFCGYCSNCDTKFETEEIN